MGKVVIAGGSGFLGQETAKFLLKLDHEVVILTRGIDAQLGRSVKWTATSTGDWAKELEGALAVINFTGKPVATKWSEETKNEIVLSRIQSTKAIAEAIKQCAEPPKVWINASAVGIYGDRGAEELDENSSPGKQRKFLVDTCVAWEAACDDALIPDQVRRVKLRTGIVLGAEGGAYKVLAKLTKMFLGSHVGGGRQFVPWVHVDDFARIVVHCIDKEVSGPLNAVSPNPCTNEFLMASMRAVLGRPWAPGIPAFILKIANWFGGPEPSLVLESQRVKPTKLAQGGFQFIHDELRETIMSLEG